MIPHKELLARLRRLKRAANANVSSINYGGCGVMASIVGAELLKLGLTEVEVATIGSAWPDSDVGMPACKVRDNVRNAANTDEWDENGLDRGHMAVRFRAPNGRVYSWDSDEGITPPTKVGRWRAAGKLGEGLTVAEAKLLASSAAGWNSTFNRRQIPLLRHLARHHLGLGLH